MNSASNAVKAAAYHDLAERRRDEAQAVARRMRAEANVYALMAETFLGLAEQDAAAASAPIGIPDSEDGGRL